MTKKIVNIMVTRDGSMFLYKHFAWYPRIINRKIVWLKPYWVVISTDIGHAIVHGIVGYVNKEDCVLGVLSGEYILLND